MNAPAPNETSSWHEVYRSENLFQRRQKTHAGKLEKLGILKLPKTGSILDVCCGTGEMLAILEKHGFRNLTGVDLAPPPEQPASWHFLQGSATQLPVESASFDVIYCAHAFHHLGSLTAIESFLKEAYRCLKPGGLLAVIDHYDSPQLRIAFGLIQSPLGNMTAYTRDFRKQLLEEKRYLYDYLNSWPGLKNILNTTSFKNFKMQRDLFFFYWTGFKL